MFLKNVFDYPWDMALSISKDPIFRCSNLISKIVSFSSNIGNWANLILLHSAQMRVKKEALAILLVLQMLLTHLSHSLTSSYK